MREEGGGEREGVIEEVTTETSFLVGEIFKEKLSTRMRGENRGLGKKGKKLLGVPARPITTNGAL